MPLASIAARCMAGKSLAEQNFSRSVEPKHYAVKESVFPFVKFPGVDPLLGPEMKSTGEVMGSGRTFAEAFGKSSLAAGMRLPEEGVALLSVRDADKRHIGELAAMLHQAEFSIVATSGTHVEVVAAGYPCTLVNKVKQGRPHVVDIIKNDEVSLIINTVEGRQAIACLLYTSDAADE